MRSLGAAMVGGLGKRSADDFYPTPPEATTALLLRWGAAMPRRIWEPACGDGAVASVLRQWGFSVALSDTVDRGCGAVLADFTEATVSRGEGIVTNPPFKLAAEFIAKAHALPEVRFTAMLLKSTYWHAKRRTALWLQRPPSFIHPLLWRLDFDGRGAPTMDCSWMVWLEGDSGARYEPMQQPLPGVFD